MEKNIKIENKKKFFYFTLSNESQVFFENLIYTKIVEGFSNYTLTSAFFEGYDIIREKNKNVPKRQSTLRRYNKKGKGTINNDLKKEKRTSIISTEEMNDWIEDYICYKIMYNELYNKKSFVDDIAEVLKIRYKKELKKAPKLL